jgi:ankyrin repeat protein
MDQFKLYVFEFLLLSSILLLQIIKLPKGVTWKKNVCKGLFSIWGLFFLFILYGLIIQIPLFKAICANNIEEVSRIIKKESSQIKSRKILGQTTLHEAVRCDHPEIAEYLIKNGADVNAVDVNHVTPLHIAVEENNIMIAEILLKSGANINARGFRDKFTPLHLAIFNKNIRMAKFLFDNGADITIKDGSGETAVKLASKLGVVWKDIADRTPGKP